MNRRQVMIAVPLATVLVTSVALALRPKPQRIEVGRVARGPLKVTVWGAGRTRVRDRFTIKAPVAGHLARIALRAGDTVETGQRVAWIAPGMPPLLDARTDPEARARVAAAEAAEAAANVAGERAQVARAQAARELERVKTLAAEGSAPLRDLERARLDLDLSTKEAEAAGLAWAQAGREVEAARAALVSPARRVASGREYRAIVYAPMAGRVLRVVNESEGPVTAGAPLIEVGDPESLEAVLEMLTTDAVRVAAGSEVEIDGWGGNGVLRGRVRLVEPSAFTKISALAVEEQRVNVVIDPSRETGWRALADGFRIEGRIVVREAHGLNLPAGALFRHGESWAVFVLSGGHARLRLVEVGESDGSVVEVLAGASEGEMVVLHPGDTVDDGTDVSVG